MQKWEGKETTLVRELKDEKLILVRRSKYISVYLNLWPVQKIKVKDLRIKLLWGVVSNHFFLKKKMGPPQLYQNITSKQVFLSEM